MTAPGDRPAPWRGPVDDWHAAAPPPATDAAGAALTLFELSRRARFGVKGRRALQWLVKAGIAVPAANNRAEPAGAELLVARLGPGEALLLATGSGGAGRLAEVARLLERKPPAGAYAVPRQDMSAWFRVEGAGAPALFAALCAVDLRPARFSAGAVAQTSVALQSAIVVRDDRDADLGFDMLTDFASGAYLWGVLVDQLATLGGNVVAPTA